MDIVAALSAVLASSYVMSGVLVFAKWNIALPNGLH